MMRRVILDLWQGAGVAAVLGMASVLAGPALAAPTNLVPVMSEEGATHREVYAQTISSGDGHPKVRYTLIHEVPSPSRIAGERRYEISDSVLQLSVDGSQIRIKGDRVLPLRGINSARGRTGEIIFLDGGTLDIGPRRGGYTGVWDIDGINGPADRAVQPDRRVSGAFPVRIRTYDANGNVVTDEENEFIFKPITMGGPYNGVYDDGTNVAVWMWGMTRNKISSGEFTYVGLDIAVSSFQEPELALSAGDEDTTGITPVFAPLQETEIFKRSLSFPTTRVVTTSSFPTTQVVTSTSGSTTSGSTTSTSSGTTTSTTSTTSSGTTTSASTSTTSSTTSSGTTTSSTTSTTGSGTTTTTTTGSSGIVVPEPSPGLLVGFGAAVMALAVRRRRRAASKG